MTANEVEWLGIYRGLTKRGAFDVDSKLSLDVYQFLEELLKRRQFLGLMSNPYEVLAAVSTPEGRGIEGPRE